MLINLDDACLVYKYETEGIFIQEGDLIYVTARNRPSGCYYWDVTCGDHPFDYDVIYPIIDYDFWVFSEFGEKQEILILEGAGTGKKRFDFSLFIGDYYVRQVSIDVYVNMQPALTSVTPRNSCTNCYNNAYY